MKKIIIILLFIAGSLQGQWNNSFDWYGSKKITAYNSRALDFFARVVTAGKVLTESQKRWYNDYIFVPLTSAGIIGTVRANDSLDSFYSLNLKWAGDSTVANMNILANEYNCIHYGVVIYTDSGIVGNGTGYLKTFFTPSTANGRYSLNSGMIGAYCKSYKGADGDLIGVVGANILFRTSSFFMLNLNNTSLYSSTLAPFKGSYILTRRDASTINLNNNNLILNLSYASGSVPTYPFFVGAFNSSGTAAFISTDIISFGLIGSGLSETKTIALTNIMNDALKQNNYDEFNNHTIVCDGNSLTVGYQDGGGANSYPSKLFVVMPKTRIYNMGVNGRTTLEMISNYATAIKPLYNSNHVSNILIAWEGTNSFITQTADSAFNQIKRYCVTAKADGWKVVVGTVLPRGTDTDFETRRITYNDLLRVHYSEFADGLADFGGDATIGLPGSQNNTTYYNADKIHLNEPGNVIVKNIVYNITKNW